MKGRVLEFVGDMLPLLMSPLLFRPALVLVLALLLLLFPLLELVLDVDLLESEDWDNILWRDSEFDLDRAAVA